MIRLGVSRLACGHQETNLLSPPYCLNRWQLRQELNSRCLHAFQQQCNALLVRGSEAARFSSRFLCPQAQILVRKKKTQNNKFIGTGDFYLNYLPQVWTTMKQKNEIVPSVADSLLRSQMTCSITALKHTSPALCQSVIVNALAALLHSVEENILRAKDVQFSYGISWIIAALWPVHFSSTRYGQYCIKPVTVTGCLGQFSIINLVKNDCSLIENSLRAFSPSECSC